MGGSHSLRFVADVGHDRLTFVSGNNRLAAIGMKDSQMKYICG